MVVLCGLLLLLSQDALPLLYETIDGNAADVYTSLRGRFEDMPEILSEFDWKPSSDRQALRTAIAPYADVLEKCERAVRMKQCRWDHPGLKAIDGDMPHLHCGIPACRLFVVRCRLRLEAGEIDGAMDDLLAAYRISSDYGQDPLLVSGLVGNVGVGLIHDVWLTALSDRAIPRDSLRRLEAHLTHLIARHPSVLTAYRHEKSIMVAAVDRIVADFPAFLPLLEGIPRRGASKDPLAAELGSMLQAEPEMARKLLKRRLEESYDAILLDAEQPLHAKERRHDGEAMKKDVARRWTAWQRSGKEKAAGLVVAVDSVTCMVSAVLNDKVRSRYVEGRLTLELHRLRTRLELSRLQTGGYPPELEAGLAVTDPFTGKPMIYVRIVEPSQEAFVVTREGPKSDAEERIRVLSKESKFDWAHFEDRQKKMPSLTTSTLWARRAK